LKPVIPSQATSTSITPHNHPIFLYDKPLRISMQQNYSSVHI